MQSLSVWAEVIAVWLCLLESKYKALLQESARSNASPLHPLISKKVAVQTAEPVCRTV